MTATIAPPAVDPVVAPFLDAIPVQLLAYHAAVLKSTDIARPRNLAKSVRVDARQKARSRTTQSTLSPVS